jgi:tryptophan synthase alpha chain
MPAGARLGAAFAERAGSTGLVPFLTAGYPSLDATLELLHAFQRDGALAVEIGIPFSDPIADGPDIQRASEWALERGVAAAESLGLVREFRASGGTLPVVVMTYANPILRGGIESFATGAREAGVDGVLVSDLPPDESPETWRALDRAGLDTIVLVAPTTASTRLPVLIQRCRGFVYCLARTGVTGAGAGYGGAIGERVAELRGLTALPIAVGFGIATGEQAHALAGVADAVVVGAALMREVARDPARGAVERVSSKTRELIDALRPAARA